MDYVTIFTPTYNRAYILERAYKSLINQTSKNFEWLIVDDGSVDNTKELIKKWKKEKLIDIKYIYQKNQGKQIAHNTGVNNAKYELFLCLDSDDYLTSDCIETILNNSNKIINDEFVGIIAKRGFINKKNKYLFPKNVEYSTLTELSYKYNYLADLLLVFKTNIIKSFPFPKFENEKFVPETFLYDQVDNIGKMLLIDKELYMCEYLEDGYTSNSNKLIKNNPIGYRETAFQRMHLTKIFKNKVRSASQYIVGCWLSGYKNIIKKENRFQYKILIIFCYPIALVLYLKKYGR